MTFLIESQLKQLHFIIINHILLLLIN